MKKILILTHFNDNTADLVIQKLFDKKAVFARFNTEEFPKKVKLTIKLNGKEVVGKISSKDFSFCLNEIKSVWYRRPHRPEVNHFKDPIAKEWVEEESQHALNCLWSLLKDCFWLNPISACEKTQFNKLMQMIKAKENGLLTPASLLTNNPNEALAFYKKHNSDLALKVIRRGSVNYDDKTLLLHTKRLRESEIKNNSFKNICYSPVFLQKYIEKKIELRITVVGNNVFACAIHSQVNEKTCDDWRKHIFLEKEIPHEIYKLPEKIKNSCINTIKDLGLCFGAIDMILTPKDEYVFLEVNPNGQWGWIEELTHLPISSAIADLLIKASLD